MKKYLLFVISFLILPFTSFGQDRIDETSYCFNKNSNKITNIIGWSFNENEGKWVSNPNFINSEKKWNDKRFSTGCNSIQISSFIENGVTNYVLIVSYNGGHYTYPSIHSDWNNYIEYKVFLLSKERYELITNINDETSFCVPCITYNNWYDKKTENYIIRQILSALKSYRKGFTSFMGEFMVMRYKDVIRFMYDNDNVYRQYEHKKNNYFEISIEEWDKLKIN
jgi:hypothetical protein